MISISIFYYFSYCTGEQRIKSCRKVGSYALDAWSTNTVKNCSHHVRAQRPLISSSTRNELFSYGG